MLKMFRKEITLYKMCLEKIANLLKNSYWKPFSKYNNSVTNPFSSLPSTIVDELVVAVTHMSDRSKLKSSDLYHLISSNRMKHFKLEDVHLTLDSLVDILMSLSESSQNLKSLKIKNVFCSEFYEGQIFRRSDLRSEALEWVLNMSPQLESIESCVKFNLVALKNCEHLKVLKMNFVPENQLFDFLEETDGKFWYNNSLRVLEVYEDVRHPFSYLDIAVVLKYCTELVEINCDISKSLEYLHAEELYSGYLNTQYKLQKCCLGNIFLDTRDAALTRDSVYIATLTCPSLRELDVLVNDPLAIYALSDFKNLTSLLLQYETMGGGSFLESVPELLRKIGLNLKTFHLINFADVDFALIGINCPNLEEFRVEYIGASNQNEFTPTCFKKMTNLHIENFLDGGFSDGKTILGLLSNCHDLESLNLLTADGLTDEVLSSALRKNKLSNVKEARILNCSLATAGIQNLASNLSSLEYLEIRSLLLPFDDVASVIHAVNREVIISNVL